MLESNLFNPFGNSPKLPPVKPEIKEILRQQQITLDTPGRILKDWQTFLNFIGTDGVEVSAKTNHFSMKILPSLNASLSRPIEIDLKRPQQKSYPYIHGLYLLVRTLGLAYTVPQGKKTKLVINQELLETWQQLNTTEQYLILLETWMFEASEEQLEGYWTPSNLFKIAYTWQNISLKEVKITKQNIGKYHLDHKSSLSHLAILDGFGFLNIEQGKPLPNQGWRVSRLGKTVFGDALMEVLVRAYTNSLEQSENEQDSSLVYGKLQSDLKEYFPEYQHQFVMALNIEKGEFVEGVYQFKVSLGKVWRRILIPSDLMLDDLVYGILSAFEFDDDHLYRFVHKTRFGRILRINHPYMEDPPFTDDYQVGELLLEVGETMMFIFDFGDNWEFSVLLESINDPNPKLEEPMIIKRYGDAPSQYDYDDDW